MRVLPVLCRAKLGAGATWKEVVNAAYLDRVDLSAHGFYATPDVTGFGGNRPFNYFCFGASVSEVGKRQGLCAWYGWQGGYAAGGAGVRAGGRCF